MKSQKALLIIDVQNDFCPGGTLGVPQAEKIIPAVNKYLKLFKKNKLPIFATRDWHPPKTRHFKDFGGAWPAHCIQNTRGAAFHPRLKLPKEAVLLYKGMDPQEDSYSAFQAEDTSGMDFLSLLKRLKISELYVGGLATDYCVRSSVIDALKQKFKVRLLMDAVRGVDFKKGDSEKTVKEMITLGAKAITLNKIKERP